MNPPRRFVIGQIVLLNMLCFATSASAQNFFEKLGQQLNQQLNPNAPREPLPPPRELPAQSVLQSGRATLGIRVASVSEEAIRLHSLVVRRGAVITAIDRGSPADKASLPLGAAIVAFDGQRIDSPDELVRAVQSARPGQEVELTFYDRDRLARKKVTLATEGSPNQLPTPAPPRVLVPPNSPATPLLPSGAALEQQLGQGGSRPILGRLGRILDQAVQGVPPNSTPLTPGQPTLLQPVAPASAIEVQRIEASELAALRSQISELSKQVEALRRQVEALERKSARR